MSKLNKRGGFTLAELLIVIAIIAILIAIAIPVFSGQLENAKLQADHANIRSCYAAFQVAQLEGTIEGITALTDGETYYFQQDGSFANTTANAYEFKATGDATKCKPSAGCNLAKTTTLGDNHIAGKHVGITYTAPTSTAGAKFAFVMN